MGEGNPFPSLGKSLTHKILHPGGQMFPPAEESNFHQLL
jgi:hypothetical protein